MPAKTITCPDCGLVLRVARDDTGSTLLYDVRDWQRRCKRVDLDNPTWCLPRCAGTDLLARPQNAIANSYHRRGSSPHFHKSLEARPAAFAPPPHSLTSATPDSHGMHHIEAPICVPEFRGELCHEFRRIPTHQIFRRQQIDHHHRTFWVALTKPGTISFPQLHAAIAPLSHRQVLLHFHPRHSNKTSAHQHYIVELYDIPAPLPPYLAFAALLCVSAITLGTKVFGKSFMCQTARRTPLLLPSRAAHPQARTCPPGAGHFFAQSRSHRCLAAGSQARDRKEPKSNILLKSR